MSKRDPVRLKDKVSILLDCRRRCCLCYHFERDLTTKENGQIVHIDRDSTNASPENLAYLCLDCHARYDSTSNQAKRMEPDELRFAKKELQTRLSRNLNAEERSSTLTLRIDAPIEQLQEIILRISDLMPGELVYRSAKHGSIILEFGVTPSAAAAMREIGIQGLTECLQAPVLEMSCASGTPGQDSWVVSAAPHDASGARMGPREPRPEDSYARATPDEKVKGRTLGGDQFDGTRLAFQWRAAARADVYTLEAVVSEAEDQLCRTLRVRNPGSGLSILADRDFLFLVDVDVTQVNVLRVLRSSQERVLRRTGFGTLLESYRGAVALPYRSVGTAAFLGSRVSAGTLRAFELLAGSAERAAKEARAERITLIGAAFSDMLFNLENALFSGEYGKAVARAEEMIQRAYEMLIALVDDVEPRE